MLRSDMRVALFIVCTTLMLGACNVLKVFQPTDDKAITTEIQAKLFDDPVLKTRDIKVTSQKGIVTLTGSVGTELEKAAVERLAGQASGVKGVMNQLAVSATPAVATPTPETPATTVATAAPPVATAAPEQPSRPARHRERASTAHPRESAPEEPAYTENPSAAASAPATTAAAPPQAAAPAVRQPEHITIPVGTVVTVRMIDSIDSQRNRPGEEFAATVDAPIVVGDRVVIPRGSDARVRLVQSASAGRMAGRSELQLELVGLAVGSNTYSVESGRYEKQGASRGTRTAETVGGGAALGALIGAIAGHGKGAAIGAAVGAGAGTAVQAGTHGQQVKVPSETKLDFTLKVPITVTM
jgi:hypothetical protein